MMAFWKTRKVGPEGPEVSGGSGAGTGCWVGCADGEAILRCTGRYVSDTSSKVIVKDAIAIDFEGKGIPQVISFDRVDYAISRMFLMYFRSIRCFVIMI
jgi:hypothetical protein